MIKKVYRLTQLQDKREKGKYYTRTLPFCAFVQFNKSPMCHITTMDISGEGEAEYATPKYATFCPTDYFKLKLLRKQLVVRTTLRPSSVL